MIAVRTHIAALACVVIVAGAACQSDEKIVHYKPFFSGLAGVETQTPPVYGKESVAPSKMPEPAAAEPDKPGEPVVDKLVVTTPDGKKKLISGSGVQLMYHIQTLLASGDAQLFADQVLCETTRREYLSRGLDPKEAFKTAKEREKEIAKMFARMPMGEHSPNVLMEPLGGNVFRVKLTGTATHGLEKWVGFDMVLEKGNWKLRWFV
jgi:hypothetical protein